MSDEFNPYQPPSSGLDHPLAGARVWRHKRQLVMQEGALLPERCYRCNDAHASRRLSLTVYWIHPWAILLLVAVMFVPVYGWLLFFFGLVALGLVRLRKRTRVEYSICGRHNRMRWTYTGVTLALLSASLAATAWALSPTGMALAPDARDALLALAGLLLLVGLLVGITGRGLMRPATRQYSGGLIKLAGFGRPFLDSLEDDQGPTAAEGVRGAEGEVRIPSP